VGQDAGVQPRAARRLTKAMPAPISKLPPIMLPSPAPGQPRAMGRAMRGRRQASRTARAYFGAGRSLIQMRGGRNQRNLLLSKAGEGLRVGQNFEARMTVHEVFAVISVAVAISGLCGPILMLLK